MNSPNFASIVPCFSVADVGATIRWLRRATRIPSDPFPQSEPYLFAILFRDGIEIMLQRIEGYEKPGLYERRGGGVWNAYIRMEGVKEPYESVQHRVTIVKPLQRPAIWLLGI